MWIKTGSVIQPYYHQTIYEYLQAAHYYFRKENAIFQTSYFLRMIILLINKHRYKTSKQIDNSYFLRI